MRLLIAEKSDCKQTYPDSKHRPDYTEARPTITAIA
jgi:hypothetical protein